MTKYQKTILFFLRLSLGVIFLYAGLTKVVDPAWSAAGYLQGAKTLPAFFHWFASPTILPFTNLLNEWGLTLIGLSLLLGFWVRASAGFGALLMILYYLPILDFTYPNAHSLIVDDHVIYFFALLLLGALRAGRVFGLDGFFWRRRLSRLGNETH